VKKLELGQVIKQLRTAKGLTQTQLGEAIGVDRGNVSRYESGANAPDFDRLQVLADTLGMAVSDMFARAETGNVEIAPEIKGTVPLISWVQAGRWNDVIDNLHPGEGERIPTKYRVRKHTYALRVRGDSMEPKFPEGAILIVEPDENPEPGAFVIVRHNGGEATFKQLMVDGDTRYLKPLNSRYPIMEVKPDAVFCGVVKRVEMDV
jgi:SOS-response transcriptional repressor LexA